MTIKQEEAIEVLKKCWVITTEHLLDEENKKVKDAIETVLSLLEEKNEIIDLMSEVIMEDENLMCEINFEKWKSKKEVKNFFEKIVKE